MAANRVSGLEVKEIMDTSLTGAQLEVFVTSASLIVSEKLSGSGFTDEHLKEIERWLSAHFASVIEKEVTRERVGDTEFTYNTDTYVGIGLNSTSYGRNVLLLDSTGTLGVLDKKKIIFDNIDDD